MNTKKNIENQIKYKLMIDTAVDPIPILGRNRCIVPI